MATGTLTYDLFEESEEHRVAVMSKDLYFALDDLKDLIRNNLKYNADDLVKKNGYETMEKFQDDFFEILDARNISLEILS